MPNINNNIPPCQVQVTETCLPNGDLQIGLSYGAPSGLFQVQVQAGGVLIGPIPVPCCEANASGCPILSTLDLQPNPIAATGWDDVTITAYCDIDESIQNALSWDGTGTQPAWAIGECGTSTLASNTAIYFFYDTTSLDEDECEVIYLAANDWIIALRNAGTYTGKVYHIAADGERWVLWPAWVVDHNVNCGGTDDHSNACNGGTSCHDPVATPWAYALGDNAVGSNTFWTNDANASLGSGQPTATLPVAPEGPTANVLVVCFADEAQGVPMSSYRADPVNQTANTGNWGPDGATGGSYPEFGNTNSNDLNDGYHFKNASTANIVTPWEEATGGQLSTAPGDFELTDLWKYDVLRAKTIIANHQSSGTLKTFVYPAVHSSTNSAQNVFPLHLLGAITTGTLASAPTCNIADLTNITLSNPYSTQESGRFGQLDALNFGCNVECAAFTSGTFVTDLEAFITGSGPTTQCDQTDCVRVQVVSSDTGAAISGHVVDIGGTNYTTDSLGYTPMVTGLGNYTINIGPCETLNLLRDCRQHLVILKYFEHTHTPTALCIYGCTDNWTINGAGLGINGALNYDPTANIDDGSCIYCIYGCTNPLSLNYNPAATCDDGSCQVMPDTAECLLKDISKQLLEDCTDLCETNPKIEKLRSDLQYAESLLAQFYQMYKCDTVEVEGEASPLTVEAYTKIFSAFRKLFQEYQCDNCGQYHPGQTGISAGDDGSTQPADCEVDFGGNCTSLIADPGQDVISAVTSIDGGTTWTSMGTPPNVTNLGDVTGKIAQEQHICFDDLEEQLEACGMSTIGIDTKIYCFYDGTSLGQAAVEAAFIAVHDWLDLHPDFTPVLRDPSQQVNYNNQDATGAYAAFSYGTTPGENVFHISIGSPGENWLDWGIVPITGMFDTSVDESAEQTAQSNKGGYIGDHLGAGGNHTGGTKHVEGFGHATGESAGYSYTGSTGIITGKLNHWVGWGVSFAGTKSGAPTKSEWPLNFAVMSAGSANRATSLSKPDGTEFNNVSNNLRTSWAWPLYPDFGYSVQAINWSFDQWKNSNITNLPGGGTVQPVQFYCPSSYDTATGQGPKGHSVFTYNSTNYTAPNTWTRMAEEADAATANNASDPIARSQANCVHLGPPPIAEPATDNVLVIVFADESVPAYHDRSSGSTPDFTGTFYSLNRSEYNPYYNSPGAITGPAVPHLSNFTTYDLADERIVQPTYRYKYDLLEFNARRAAYTAVSGKSYQAFFYPSKPSGGAMDPHKALPLQGLAAIANGTSAAGMWAAGTAPTTSGTNTTDSPYPDSTTGINDKCAYADLTALETANPYWNLTDHPIPAGNSDSINWGGLEDKGWWINTQCRTFTASRFETDLELFLGQGGTSCDGTDCVNFRILENGSPKVGAEFAVNGVVYTTDASGEITNISHAALLGLVGTITFGFEGAEAWSYTLPGACTEFTFIFDYGESEYTVCVTYPEITCACITEPGDPVTAYITINTGSNTPTDESTPADGIIGTITNLTTEVVTNILDSMIGGTAPDITVTVPFRESALTANEELADGLYVLELEGVGGTPWKECRLILCEAAGRLQELFKDNMCNIKCNKCDKVYEDFIVAYTLFRALKITGWDYEYIEYVNSKIEDLQAALTAAESGNCKCC